MTLLEINTKLNILVDLNVLTSDSDGVYCNNDKADSRVLITTGSDELLIESIVLTEYSRLQVNTLKQTFSVPVEDIISIDYYIRKSVPKEL